MMCRAGVNGAEIGGKSIDQCVCASPLVRQMDACNARGEWLENLWIKKKSLTGKV
jgi:hypothetical protein